MTAQEMIVTLVAIVICAVIFACWDADLRARFADTEHDWREDWCCPECYADHEQEGPCLDCPARKAAMRWWG